MFDKDQLIEIMAACTEKKASILGAGIVNGELSTADKEQMVILDEVIVMVDTVIGDDDSPYWRNG